MLKNQELLVILNNIYIGIDLAWGENNLSGFCVSKVKFKKLDILELKLIKSIDEIINEILKYTYSKVYVAIDAPLIVTNEINNREIEKNFNKDFAKYKISMFPINRKLLTKYSDNIRSEELYQKLTNIGFKRDYNSSKVMFEVYPHSIIAMCFNNHKILPYKRKKGRKILSIKKQLVIYKNYLNKEFISHKIFKEDIMALRGQSLKDYEDKLDAITCAYSIWYCQNNDFKLYKLDGVDTFLTPISKWKVYMLQCNDDSIYTGITTSISRRVDEHNNSKLGAKYTSMRRPVKLIYYENCSDRKNASIREYEIKKLSHKEKLNLIN